MALRNAFGAIALDSTVAAARDLLTTIRDSVSGVLKTRGDVLTLPTATISANGAVVDGTTDLTNYTGVRVGIYGTFSGNMMFEVSNDLVNWQQRALNYSTGGSGVQAGGLTHAHGPIGAKYFRVRATSWTSGTATIAIWYSTGPTEALGSFSGSLGSSTNNIGKIRPDAFSTSGSVSALNGVVDGTTDCTNFSAVRVQVTGTWSGTLTLQSSIDGTNWVSRALSSVTSSPTNVLSGNSLLFGDVGGRYFRVLMTAYTSGTAIIALLYTAATSVSGNIAIRSAANGDGVNAATIDEVAIGGFNGSTIDRLVTNFGASATANNGRAMHSATGSVPVSSLSNATAPTAGSALSQWTARSNHTLQVDLTTATIGTAGNHIVRLEGSMDNGNWFPLASVSLAASSTTATDPSNHAAVSASDQPFTYIRANWTTIPTGWTGTLTARVASA